MLTLKLVRHGESEANLRYELAREIGDHNVVLTAHGREQARMAGAEVGRAFLDGALLYCSPYRRTRETLDEMLIGSGHTPKEAKTRRRYEDPRLREVEHGYEDAREQEQLQRTHGWFYYRFRGGESPADCFDRTSGFLEGMMRQIERKGAERVLIVTHGLAIRCFVMRFLHLSIEQFDTIDNPHNADVVTLSQSTPGALFDNGKWCVTGLRLRGVSAPP